MGANEFHAEFGPGRSEVGRNIKGHRGLPGAIDGNREWYHQALPTRSRSRANSHANPTLPSPATAGAVDPVIPVPVRNLRLVGTVVLGVSVVLLLAVGLSWHHTRAIEADLAQRVQAQLRSGGFDTPEFRVDGREVVLLGEVDAHIDRGRMAELIRSVPGVDGVDDRRVVVNFSIGRRFELHSYAGITTVEGEVPNRNDQQRILAAIRKHFGVDPLGSDLRINSAVRPLPWLDRFDRLLNLTSTVSPLEIGYGDDQMVITGTVPDADARERVREAVHALLGSDFGITVSLQIPAAVLEPEVHIRFASGSVSVSGRVPDDDFRRDLLAALRLAFLVEEVDSALEVDENIRRSDWLEGLLRVVFPLAMTRRADLEIRNGEAILRGLVRNARELEILDEQVRENFDYAIRLLMRVDTETDSG